jgi:hypothetical protein
MDRPPPATVRAYRSVYGTRAIGVRHETGAHYAVCSCIFELSEFQTAHASTDGDPTLRPSIVRERMARVKATLLRRRFAALTRRHTLPDLGHLSERRTRVVRGIHGRPIPA